MKYSCVSNHLNLVTRPGIRHVYFHPHHFCSHEFHRITQSEECMISLHMQIRPPNNLFLNLKRNQISLNDHSNYFRTHT